MSRVLGPAPGGGYSVQTDSGQVITVASLPPGLSEPGVLNVPGLSPPVAGPAAPTPPPAPTDPFSQQMRAKLRADVGIPETMTPDEMAAGKPRPGAASGPALVNYQPGMGGARGGGPAPGYAPARVIPGHMQLAQQSTTGTQIDPETAKQLREDQKQVVESTGKVQEAEADANEKLATLKREQGEDFAISNLQSQKDERDRRAKVEEETGKLQQYQDEYRSGSYVDEGIKKFGGRAVAGIAAALSAAGDALAKTGGAFTANLNRSMDRYIDESREKSKGKVSDQENLLSRLDKEYGNRRQADAAARVLMLDNANRQIDALVTENASPQMRARAQQMKDEIKAKQDEWMADFTKQSVTKHEVMTKPTVIGGPPKAQEVENKLLVKDLNGNTYVADDEASAKDARKNHALVTQAIDAANEMKQIANASAGEKLDPTSPMGQKFAFAQERYTNAMNTLQGQGVVRGEDVERYQKYTGGQFGFATAKMADELAQKARLGYDSQVKAIVDTDAPARREWYRDPKTGEVRRRAVYDLDQAQNPAAPVNFTPTGAKGP